MKKISILLLGVVILFGGYVVYKNNQSKPPKLHCKSYEPINESKIKAKINKKLEDLSNSKDIASLADQTLSGLLKAQSPIIYSWIDKRGYDVQTQTDEVAYAWRLYYLKNFILKNLSEQKNETQEAVFNVINEIIDSSFSSDEKDKIIKNFEFAKKQSLKRIDSYDMDESMKANIKQRISEIEILLPTRLSESERFKQYPLEFLNWGIAYDPVPNQINIGIEALSYKTDQQLFSIFTHEIGHAFDTCRWVAFFQGENPFKNVISCLRGSQAANALKRDDSQMSKLIEKGALNAELAEGLKYNKTCNFANYPPIGTQKDQMPETFADWFSAEVISITPRFINENLRIDLCEEKQLIEGSSYLSNQNRLERIYFVQPKIAEKLNYSTNSKYCGFKL